MQLSAMKEHSAAREASICARPSYLLGAADVTPDTFPVYGLLCRVDTDGRRVCNVAIGLQLQPGLEIDWGSESPGCDQLAINILSQFFDVDDRIGATGNYSPIVDSLFRQFAEDMLWEMPASGGCIPIEELVSWLSRHIDNDDDDDIAA